MWCIRTYICGGYIKELKPYWTNIDPTSMPVRLSYFTRNMKIKWNKLYHSMTYRGKLPRKAKKFILGRKPNKKSLKELLGKVEIIESEDSRDNEIHPYPFCPKCGCLETRVIDHGVPYPERWVDIFCARCNHLVCTSDNSPYYHCLEYKSDNYFII